MGMYSGLPNLPFDVFHQVASQLPISSYISLSQTCRSAYEHLQDEKTARKSFKRDKAYSNLGRVTFSGSEPSVREVLGRCNDAQEAIQTASPYSACVIAHATSFQYHCGVLCYTTSEDLRILDFNEDHGIEKVFHYNILGQYHSQGSSQSTITNDGAPNSVQVHGYGFGIVSLLCNYGHAEGQSLIALNISDKFISPRQPPRDHPRILLRTQLRSTCKLFVRHNAEYLFIGTHSATGSHGHREWLLEGFSLDTGQPLTKPLQLENFFGSDMNSNVAFTIHDDYFYALTTQTSFESEEVDWSSYYKFFKFRVDESVPLLKPFEIWRRQHREGPINDAWSDLRFDIDHEVGELLIVECRKEWINGGSRCIRTCYVQPLDRAEIRPFGEGARHPPDDRLRLTLDRCNHSRWEEPLPRIDKYIHSEYRAEEETPPKEYLRAKTKWNGYSYNSQSFVDLVMENFTVDGEWRPRERIKLRVVSRSPNSPLEQSEKCGLVVRRYIQDRKGENIRDSEEAFKPNRISLWPADDAPRKLQNILCPAGKAGEVKAELGDEGLIYMAGPPRERGERALVFISFYPTFGFHGITDLHGRAVHKRGTRSLPMSERKRKLGVWAEDSNELNASQGIEELSLESKRVRMAPKFEESRLQEFSLTKLDNTPGNWPPPATTPSPVALDVAASSSRTTSKHGTENRKKSTYLLKWKEEAAYTFIRKGVWLR